MSDNVNLNTFPSNKNEALALEYAKLMFSEGTTPQQFAESYRTAYALIKQYFIEVRQGLHT